jgi:predicted ester cyclase
MSNKDIAQEFMTQLWQQRNFDVIDRHLSADAVIRNPFNRQVGSLTMHEVAQRWLEAFPDLLLQVDSIVEEGNVVAARWHARGTHLGSFFATQPTHEEISYMGVTFFTFNESKIVDYWVLVDVHWILKQLGSPSLEEVLD